MISINQSHKLAFLFVALISAILCFYNLDKAPLASWDESLYGVNAYEMDKQDDWFNAYFKGKPDQWNVKPPLFVNLVRLSHHLLGNNKLALRLPSAISCFILLMMFYSLLKPRLGNLHSILVLAMLWGCTGLIGHHSGRTGDTDALFALLVFSTALFVLKYSDNRSGRFLLLAAMAAGLGFLTKSTMIFLIFPGLLVFLLIKKCISLKTLVPAAMIFLLFPVSWLTASHFLGIEFENSVFGGNSSWTNSFIHDTLNRFTGEGMFQEKAGKKPDFFLVFLDSRFNLWHIPFIGAVALLIVQSIKHRIDLVNKVRMADNLLVLSVCLIVPYMIVLSASENVHQWYMVPLLPFIAVITGYGFQFALKRWRYVIYIWVGLAIFTTARHLYEHQQTITDTTEIYQAAATELNPEDCLYIERSLAPHEVLYAEWHTNNQCFLDLAEVPQQEGTGNLLLVRASTYPEGKSIFKTDKLELVKL